MGKTNVKKKPSIFKNPLEAVQGYGTDVVKSVAKTTTDELDNIFADMIGLGTTTESSKENQPHKGEVEVFNSQAQNAEKPSYMEARGHIDYHGEMMKSSEKASRSETRELSQQINEIIAELQKLISSSKVLQMEFAEVAVEQAPTSVGEYHLNFFEWMLLTIRQAREKVDDSGAWLGTVKGKNGKKGSGYWDMFKKHGTQFGMSNERSAATSTG